MSRPDPAPPAEKTWPFTNPWPFLIAGMTAIVIALLLSRLTGNSWVAVRVALIVLGLSAVGGGISIRLHTAGWDLDARCRSAGMVALGALAAVIALPVLDPAWDSARLVLGVLTAVALAGAGLLLLPQTGRRIALSLLLLFHFGGILMAVTALAPPNGPAPWLTIQIWNRVYRPYLQFMYLNNAYHFYSPEPGPPTLLWFYVMYEDGSTRWIQVPRREDYRTSMEFQRRLALTESTNILLPPGPANFDYLWQRRLLGREDEKQRTYENIRPELRRSPPEEIWKALAMGDSSILVIPPYPTVAMLPTLQYRVPSPYSKKMISSYARHVARNYPSDKDPTSKVKGVKVYRVVHRMLTPPEFLDKDRGPFFDTNYQPYYQGEFDINGNLKDPEDPFLYWIIPIVELQTGPQGQTTVYDFLKIHAAEFQTRPKPKDPPESR